MGNFCIKGAVSIQVIPGTCNGRAGGLQSCWSSKVSKICRLVKVKSKKKVFPHFKNSEQFRAILRGRFPHGRFLLAYSILIGRVGSNPQIPPGLLATRLNVKKQE